jgi:hypothetical protein
MLLISLIKLNKGNMNNAKKNIIDLKKYELDDCISYSKDRDLKQ